MSYTVSDVSGNREEKIVNAAKFLRRSEDKKKIFKAVYSGKKIKKISEIQEKAGLTNRIRVLQECKNLYSEDMIGKCKEKVDGETAYYKIDFYNNNRHKILRLAQNPRRLKTIPTKSNPKIILPSFVKIKFPRKLVNIKRISIDDIDSFSKIKGIKGFDMGRERFGEKTIKEVFKKIFEEKGNFIDWGGETDDLFTTRLRYKGKRYAAAFGLKGRGTKGILTPKKMGKHGDQIQRLFSSPADFFIIQYVGQISESVLYQMNQFAIAKSASEGREIYFGVIDGQDTLRLLKVYS